MATQLQERIGWCSGMAADAAATADAVVDGYIAELAGLMDVPLAESLEAHRGRYDLGCRDRQTLLLLADAH